MSKRDREAEEGGRPPKRPRQEHRLPAQIEEIHYARQLQQFLVFRQDGIQQLRNGIASFKAFLETILYHKDEEGRARDISILREYLESQKPTDPKDTEQPFLSQLWQAWSFANQNNNDHLASSTAAILALLLKTLSGILDLRGHGVLLCRTVLQHQHLRLLRRCLDAPKHKDFVISPCLRLITELTTFDGGLLAQEVYKRREQTFDLNTIRRNLGLAKFDVSDEEAKRKPAIRTLTVRYVLSLLKHLHEGGKIDILKNKHICGALFCMLRTDPADSIEELLNTIEQSVLKDSELPRSSKAAILTPQNLERVTVIATRGDEEHPSRDRALTWLLSVCSKPEYGVLRKAGWYPPGTTKRRSEHSIGVIDLGLDSLEFYDTEEPHTIRNSILLAFCLSLRPHLDERERKLLLACFRTAPELVAAYFSDKTMQLDPKLTNTWIGYASLLFQIVTLPVPAKFGEEELGTLPPQSSIIIENVLPRPLTQHILTRCLNQNNDLVTFFAVRILVLSFQKLAKILEQLRVQQHAETRILWEEAASRLLQSFVSRCPKLKDAIAVFRRMADDEQHALQREAITRLLRLYYEVLPLQALEDQFDVSSALTTALIRSEEQTANTERETKCLRDLELRHLLNIARHSTGTKWFHKQGGLSFSPIVTLLRISRHSQDKDLRTLMDHVFTEQGILTKGRNPSTASALDALLASVANLDDSSTVWTFLDDCIGRASRKPVKYVDDLEAVRASLKGKASDSTLSNQLPSILAAVLLEQAPFVASKLDIDGEANASWLVLFLTVLQTTSDGGYPASAVLTQTLAIPGMQAFVPSDDVLENMDLAPQTQESSGDRDQDEPANTPSPATLPFHTPTEEPTSHPELTRWSQKDVELAIEDGDIDALILCLCSRHLDIRRQGFTALTRLKTQLHNTPSFANHAQIALLIGELTETFEQTYLAKDKVPLPYIAGTFAVRALHVQNNPSHTMYPKLNKYLMRGPEWRVTRMPNYFLSNTVLNLPEEDDGYWKEITWVLDWLVDGLRTLPDLDILRRGEVFEKVLALWSSPGAAAHRGVRERVEELVWRATCVEGGSNVLVTRSGILSWLGMAGNGSGGEVSKLLLDKVKEKCDGERVKRWTGLREVRM